MSRQRLRRLVLAVHLWLGLGVGAVLALAALTGSALVFYVEIDRLLVPEQAVPPGSAPPDLDRVVQSLRQAFPQHVGEWRLELPHGPGHAVVARHATPRAETGRPFAPLMVAVDPRSGRILTARRWGDTVMTWIYDLHYVLLAGDSGRLVLAVAGIASLAVLATGFYLWWPAWGKRLQALRPRLRSGAVRQVFDLHVMTGLYGGIVLLPLILTGLVLEQPGWFKPVVDGVSPLTPAPDVTADNGTGLTAAAALAIARTLLPQARPRWVDVPGQAGGPFQIRLYQRNEPGWRFPKTSLWVSGADGAVLAVRDPADWSGGDVFFAWQHPLHNGETFGLAGRIIVAGAGLLPTVLLISGLIRWRQKRRARKAAA